MNKKKIFCIVLVIIIIAVLAFVLIKINQQKNASGNGNAGNPNEKKIQLNKESEIDTLTYTNIEGTDDYFVITDDVKWEVPEQEGTTVSASINIPYDFIIDDKEYIGNYALGDYEHVLKDDGNPKYTLEIKNLTKDGVVTVLIKEK